MTKQQAVVEYLHADVEFAGAPDKGITVVLPLILTVDEALRCIFEATGRKVPANAVMFVGGVWLPSTKKMVGGVKLDGGSVLKDVDALTDACVLTVAKQVA